MAGENKKNGGNKKIGRDKIKCQRYASRKQKEHRALKHMLKSNRFEDVRQYALDHDLKVPQKPVRRKSDIQKQREVIKLLKNVFAEE